jgi:acylphosphatase
MDIHSKNINQPKSVNAIVIGKVQGVGFRYFTQATARRYGLVGWVRNKYDGTVEIYAEGSKLKIDAFLKVIRQGSSSSHVRKVKVTWLSPKQKFNQFVIRT